MIDAIYGAVSGALVVGVMIGVAIRRRRSPAPVRPMPTDVRSILLADIEESRAAVARAQATVERLIGSSYATSRDKELAVDAHHRAQLHVAQLLVKLEALDAEPDELRAIPDPRRTR